MRPQDIIRQKRDGGELSREEVASFVRGVVEGTWADYQSSALLMAVYLNGMTTVEMEALTQAMLSSGEVLDFSEVSLPKADKHSTGGVGDKTSLIIAPLVAACEVAVPMISGRGLGHTGGTLDKLEAIPGYRVHLDLVEFRRILKSVGFAMMGQTAEIAPADRKLYALRDATETVESIPLIVASIMSKKLAAGLGALVLDVKTGSGAFMRDEGRARALARALVRTGNSCGVHTEALLTDMSQPLGLAVGNANEVQECLSIMRGETTAETRDVRDLSVELAARMVALSGIAGSLEAARERVTRALDTGAALERFRRNVEAQGGDPRVCDDPGRLSDLTVEEVRVESEHAGYVEAIDAAEVGRAVASIGGGRMRVEDAIDPAVGYLARAKVGQQVSTREPLGLLYCRPGARAEAAALRIRAAYTVGDEAPEHIPELIKEVIAQ
ncbi:MAG: pyrimidine-nucleoside phosphorylase [Acidobacteriota bacterium]|jgi:pyrimidine-nucleoside phosphorylase|nr:pyrimidine-nucleoside phosphorylase [Acidobacteriota bacterium]